MTDIKQILKLIEQINGDCKRVLATADASAKNIQAEAQKVDGESKKLVENMKKSLSRYEAENFEAIKEKVRKLVEALSEDYSDEYKIAPSNPREFNKMSLEQASSALTEIFEKINGYIAKLNSVDFDDLVPPIKIVAESENFHTCTMDGRELMCYDCSGSYPYHPDSDGERIKSIDGEVVTDPKKVLRSIVSPLFVQCKRVVCCVDYITSIVRKGISVPTYESYVESSAKAWIAEKSSKINGEFNALLDSAFLSEEAQNRYNQFFTSLAEESSEYDVDVNAGTLSFKEAVNIGDAKLLVESDSKSLSIIESSPILKKNIVNGRLSAPVIMDLKKCGNVLIEVDADDEYSAAVKHFVNQLIIQFLLSFPPNRVNFRLVDISNKMGFSPFSMLTKINTDILSGGIVRDDRMLEDAIKDTEKLMYSIEDKLSLNNVADIFEYNAAFEANPQNVNLFVLVDYPSGMREDLAQHVQKIIQNGNKCGIYTVIVRNTAVEGSYDYDEENVEKFVSAVKKKALYIREIGRDLVFEGVGRDNIFMPKKNIAISQLAGIVEMLKTNAESSKQKVVPISQLFEETDRVASSARGIRSSAEVLEIPIGVKGGEIQTLELKTTGDGSAHAVVIGGTGSGKSNLLHTIIMNVCYKYSPDEVNLYLVDFKGGVEFKYYEANKVRAKQMPHIKLTGLTSDLEDGVAILNNLQTELREREDTFRAARVEDIIQYRQLGNKMPRIFVIVDEIQELFEQDDKLGQKAIDILRELFKKGRAFGINILWASQNVPKVPGLKDKVLSQIGNRISLRLNEPDDAIDIKIDPKVVRNLNRPEKGLGVINDMRYGNESVEFRVAYAENSNNRVEYSQMIIDKWASVTAASRQTPLFIVGDDEDPKANDGATLYSKKPTAKDIVSKAFESYNVQIGQDYVTGKPFNIGLPIRENKSNVLFMGLDVEILRDLMGYSLLSVIMEHSTNADCIARPAKIYYANGEMVNPKNSADLFNVAREDFSDLIENVSSTEKFKDSVAKLYKLYKDRVSESDEATSAIAYAPSFVAVHSLQRYMDLFDSNPMISLVSEEASATAPAANPFGAFSGGYDSLFSGGTSTKSASSKESVFFVDAFKELLDRGGQFGIHFIISLDNPEGFRSIRDEIAQTSYKIFTKGISANVISQILGGYGSSNSVNNSKVALVAVRDERYKARIYRYDEGSDSAWYKELLKNYRALRG